MKIIDFIKSHFDFKFYGVAWLSAVVLLSVVLMLLCDMPQKYGSENGLLENIQMTVLIISFILCLTAKVNKKLFHFAALVLTILIIREVNCGRTLFFPRPGEYHQYYSWRELPWPWLGKVVHGVYGTWIAVVGLLFFSKKVYVDLWEAVKNIKLPVWNMVFVCFAMFMGAIAEKLTDNNMIFEEGFELLFYVSLAGIIWLYSRNENFVLKEETKEISE